jgi:alpha-beta hydrolase superfamily lysophospholipase
MRPVTFVAEDAFPLRGSYWEAKTDGAISLLLVHDRNADRRIWDPYVRFYLSRGWNVLSFDLRGHGESVRQETRTALQPPGLQPKTDPSRRATGAAMIPRSASRRAPHIRPNARRLRAPR